MDWNNINRDRDTSGLGPIEYDQSKVPAPIRKHADNVRTKTYGQEVREAQARNAELAGLIANEAVDISNETKERQDTVETQFNSVQQELTDKDIMSAPEIIAARNGKNTLNERLDSEYQEVTTQLAEKAKQHWVDVSQPPYSVVSDSVTDVSVAINKAILDVSIAGGGIVYIPYSNNKYMINPTTSIKPRNNVTLQVDDGVIFEALPTSSDSYRIFDLTDVSDFNVYGKFKMIGERDSHLGTTGEWGMGVEMRGATNIYFEYLEANNCWGDGLYIGSSTNKNYCENIVIGTLVCDNNRRQGMSVVSVRGLNIEIATLTNTNGTNPQSGIDFEPNNNLEYLQDIKIKKLITKGNANSGILVYLGTYIGSKNYVDITVDHLHSDGDYIGVVFSSGGDIQGNIVFSNYPRIENAKTFAINQRNWSSSNPAITFNKPIVIDPLVDIQGTSDRYNSAIIIIRDENDTTTGVVGDYIGNMTLIEPTIIETRKTKKIITGIFVQNYKQVTKAEKISIIDPIRIDATKQKILQLIDNPIITDKYRILVKDMANSDITAGHSDYHSSYTSKGNTTPRTILIASTYPIGTELEFVAMNNNKLTIDTRNSIYPIKDFINLLSTTKNGSRLKIRKTEVNQWVVVNIVGTWTEETRPT